MISCYILDIGANVVPIYQLGKKQDMTNKTMTPAQKKLTPAQKQAVPAKETKPKAMRVKDPIATLARDFAASDATNKVKRSKIFAELERAGATKASLASGGAHFKDFQRGVLAGWQGAAFAKAFAKTSEGLLIMAGRKITRLGDIEPVSKTRNNWNTDLSAKVGKLRKEYLDWVAQGVVPDAPAGADEVVDSRNGESPAKPAKPAKRAAGTKKPIRERVAHDAGAIAKAVVLNFNSDKVATDVDHAALVKALNEVLKLVGEKPLTMAAK